MFVCLLVTSSLQNGSSDRKPEYTIKFVRVQRLFLGELNTHSDRCVLLTTKKKNTYLMGFSPIP